MIAEEADIEPSVFGLKLSQIPEGFRDLAEPQTTEADFYYGGRYIGSETVTYTPESIIIADPAAVLSRLSMISNPDAVQAALSGEIPSNPGSICVQPRDTECGQLTPPVAGVIFDADNFRADLFIAEPYLKVKTIHKSKFLPESNSPLGLIQGISAVSSGVTGSGNNQDNYSLFGNTLLGWQENHLVANWDYSKDNSFQIDTFYLERDAQGLQMGAGYLDYSGTMTSEFASSQQVLGFKIGSSMNSRLDMANINSTPIRIFANGRRRVEVLRDNRLIYATSVNAGSQEIDTSSFPQGSYQLTIRIFNGSTLEQEFSRFYTKSVRLPPSDETLWYVEGGEMTERLENETLPESVNEWLMRAAAARRVTENSSLELRGTATGEEQTLEAEYFIQGGAWDFSLTGMAGNNSAKGLALQSSTSFGPVQLSYNHRRLWNDSYQPEQSNGEENKALFLGESNESRSLSLATAFLGGNLSGSYSYNKQNLDDQVPTSLQDDGSTTIYSLSWFRNIIQFSDHGLDLELDYSESDDDKTGTIALTLRRSSRNWNYNIRAEGRREEQSDQSAESDFGYAVDSRWSRDEILNGAGELGVRYEDLPGEQTLMGGDVKYEHARFLTEFSADYIDPDNQDSYTNYNGRLETSFAINAQGAGVGGGNRADSALMVVIDGSPDARFDVLVNGTSAGIAVGNGKTVIPLTPYGEYLVSIRPRGEQFYRYDQAEHRITLYPGNVETITFTAEEELVLLGKLIDEQGNPLKNATIPGEEGFARTDAFGIFQVRVPAKGNQLQVNIGNGQSCTATIPAQYQKRSGIGMVGVLQCR
ncbi:TcfC E-set like domain-containing protein [Parendozoicomonas haliclonae]|uniref:TcfC E-set like domain-containing protein n=1 Tax=Parendozoicomonas haliclonae TaxID=1960125 RepID=UPI0039EFCD4B